MELDVDTLRVEVTETEEVAVGVIALLGDSVGEGVVDAVSY